MVWIFRKALSLPAVAQVVSWAWAAVVASKAAARIAKDLFMGGLVVREDYKGRE
jgi:hypothetical protein